MSDRFALEPEPPAKPSALRRHAAISAAMPDRADRVLIGDSLAAAWPPRTAGEAVCNLGLPGDRIRHTLWRLDVLWTAHLRPALAIVLLGTNDLGDGRPAAVIVEGLERVVARAASLWSPLRFVVVGLPWRRPDGLVREAERLAVNRALAEAAALTPGRLYLGPDPVVGTGEEATVATVASDGLHLLPEGYRRLDAALADRLGRTAR